MCCLCANRESAYSWGILCPQWMLSIGTIFSSGKIKSYCWGHQSQRAWSQTCSTVPKPMGQDRHLECVPFSLAPFLSGPELSRARMYTCCVHASTQTHMCLYIERYTCVTHEPCCTCLRSHAHTLGEACCSHMENVLLVQSAVP